MFRPNCQFRQTARVLGAGGKPSTWLPPGRLVEHNQHPRGVVTNHACEPENKTEEPTINQTKNNYLPSPNDKSKLIKHMRHLRVIRQYMKKGQDPRRVHIMTHKIETQHLNNSPQQHKQYVWRTTKTTTCNCVARKLAT